MDLKDVSDAYQPVTLEAYDLVFGDRNAAYGHPFDDFSNTADYFTTYLHSRGLLKEGARVIAEDVAPIMSLVKLSRYANGINTGAPRRDTTVDKAGYAETEWRVIEERKRRAQVEAGLAVLAQTGKAIDFGQAVQDKAGELWVMCLGDAEFRDPTDAELGQLFREARDLLTEEKGAAAERDSPPERGEQKQAAKVYAGPIPVNHQDPAQNWVGIGPTVLFETPRCEPWQEPVLTRHQQRVFGNLAVLKEAARVWGDRCSAQARPWASLTLDELRDVVTVARNRVNAAEGAV